MFQKCGNTINLPATLPLHAAGGAEMACHDPAASSSWYSLDTQFSILRILPWMRY